MNQLPDASDLTLTDEQLDAIFTRHIQPVLDTRRRVPHPTIVTVMGPAAAGKTTLSRIMPERLGVPDPYTVDADDYYPLHPDFYRLRDQHGELQAREVIGKTGTPSTLFDRAISYALANGRNLVIAGPMAAPDWVKEKFTAWRDQGATSIHAVAIAIHEARSLLGTVDRYRQQVQASGYGRWVKPEWHDLQYPGILQSLERIERDGLADSVHIVPRGGEPVYDNVLVSRDPVVWRDPPAAAAAVQQERSRLWSDGEHTDFHRRATAVAEFAADGGLTPDQSAVAADAIRRGLPPNEQAVTALHQQATRTSDPADAQRITQRANLRGTYNQNLATMADQLQPGRPSGSAAEQGYQAARIAFQGRSGGPHSSAAASSNDSPGGTTGSRTPPPRSAPNASPSR